MTSEPIEVRVLVVLITELPEKKKIKIDLSPKHFFLSVKNHNKFSSQNIIPKDMNKSNVYKN